MTLDEMKLAVCEKLPELIYIHTYNTNGTAEGLDTLLEWIKEECEINWSTEGLQVCHEAEKLLTEKQRESYRFLISFDSPHEQRLEALCRVWFPERFN